MFGELEPYFHLHFSELCLFSSLLLLLYYPINIFNRRTPFCNFSIEVVSALSKIFSQILYKYKALSEDALKEIIYLVNLSSKTDVFEDKLIKY